MSSAAITSVHSVSPETGLFDDPIMPTRLPDTAAKKKPTMIITPAATSDPDKHLGTGEVSSATDEVVIEHNHRDRNTTAIPAKIALAGKIPFAPFGGRVYRCRFLQI